MARKCCIFQSPNGGFITVPINPGGGGTTKIQRTPGNPGQPSDNNTDTNIIFQETPFDELDAADLEVNNQQMVVDEDGIYQITGYVLWATDQAAPIFEELRIMINGAIAIDGVANKTPAAPSSSTLLAQTTLKLDKGTTVGMQVLQTNAGALAKDVDFASLVMTQVG